MQLLVVERLLLSASRDLISTASVSTAATLTFKKMYYTMLLRALLIALLLPLILQLLLVLLLCNTNNNRREIQKLGRDPRVAKRIVSAIAPSIYGHKHVKMAIALSLFGG
jgi:MCM P-loop domain